MKASEIISVIQNKKKALPIQAAPFDYALSLIRAAR